MLKHYSITAAMAVALTCALGGGAGATSFDWSFIYDSGALFDASGTLQATLIAGDEYQVTSLTGTDNAGQSLSLSTVGVDNDLYYGSASPPNQIDDQGIGFSAASITGVFAFVLYSSNTGLTDLVEGCNNTGCSPITLGSFSASLAATPLPAALPLFATALGGLGFLGWRRKRKAQSVTSSLP
jgi:hypothetical protein